MLLAAVEYGMTGVPGALATLVVLGAWSISVDGAVFPHMTMLMVSERRLQIIEHEVHEMKWDLEAARSLERSLRAKSHP